MTQLALCFDLSKLTPADLHALVLLGWAEPAGQTKDGKVTSYALTGAGRIMLAQSLKQDDLDDPPECMR